MMAVCGLDRMRETDGDGRVDLRWERGLGLNRIAVGRKVETNAMRIYKGRKGVKS